MSVLHISAECFPFAKAGGLGDVVGALPKYQTRLGTHAMVIIPKTQSSYFNEFTWEVVYENHSFIGSESFDYKIYRERNGVLGFEFFVLEIKNYFDRENIYGYDDDFERFLAFQIATLDWLNSFDILPAVVHCHDYHTGIVPFLMKYSYKYERLYPIRSVFTIHNAEYQGTISMMKRHKFPHYDEWKTGMFEWNDELNPLACAIKSCDVLTTVSPNYLEELQTQTYGLGKLYQHEKNKSFGILNGIDIEVWNPETDNYLYNKYNSTNVNKEKIKNKEQLCQEYGLNPKLPLIVYISRMVNEKSADLLPEALILAFKENQQQFNFFVIGSGAYHYEKLFVYLYDLFPNNYRSFIGYEEHLAHKLYASADFLIMPSRVEPCGLNQMYSLRYGTIPIVRRVGGLKDTVIDIGKQDGSGFGITFEQPNKTDISESIHRAVSWYQNDYKSLENTRKKIMKIDHSWESNAKEYLKLYIK
jgi:starch synthase